ncbi:hypothetical protein ES707_19877 [subsurface metagenome]
MLQEYHLKWEMDLVAESPEEAAKEGLATQRDLSSIASVFEVTDGAGNVTIVDAID